MIADSHCHLDFPNLYNQLDDVVNRATLNNIKYLLTINTTLDSFEKIKIIIENYKNIYGTFGIHPHETKNNIKINSDFIKNSINKSKKLIGIGETGLDYYYDHSDRKIQKKIFLEHINSALDLNIPLIVHSRNAENDTFEILKSENKNSNLKILIHCFTGSKVFAKKLIDINCFISISGIITFNNSKDLCNTVASIPLENLLVETDSPYLSPIPYRGKSNEPSHIVHTIDKLSKIKKVSKDDIIYYTTSNFKKLFKI